VNYRHAFHAGNHADVLKHRLIEPAPAVAPLAGALGLVGGEVVEAEPGMGVDRPERAPIRPGRPARGRSS
jgi:hypothetical protein